MGRKRTRETLRVFLEGRRVGALSRSPTGALTFQYASEWLAAPDAIPVSSSLPLREDAYQDERVLAYFDNLLPDSATIRKTVAARLGARSSGAFDLLALIGRDCVGALQLLPDGVEPEPPAAARGVALTERDIGALLRDLTAAPLGIHAESDFRISIAGAQEKTALLWLDGRWYRPEGPTPTTHILKPSLGVLPNRVDMTRRVENEFLCLLLAGHFGLRVPSVEILDFSGVRCLSVERFDRRRTARSRIVRRLPQEDLCQALGVPSTRKYESDGGPGIPQIVRFLDASDDRDGDREAFVRAQLVFFLLGAVDGHAKNFSVFLLPTGFRLTPVYDVMSVEPALRARQLGRRDARLAMCVGRRRHYRLAEIHRRHWEETARLSGFPLADLTALIEDLLERTRLLDRVRDRVPAAIPDPLAETVIRGVVRRARQLAG